jgi:hypothetical protein
MKEWISVKHTPSRTLVTCSITEDTLSVRWTVKTYPNHITAAVGEAKKKARTAMEELREATA